MKSGLARRIAHGTWQDLLFGNPRKSRGGLSPTRNHSRKPDDYVIGDALEFVREVLRNHLGVADAAVIVDSARTLMAPGAAPGAYVSVVNVQEDTSFRTHSSAEQRGNASQYRQPPLHLNVDVMFSFSFETYHASLELLSKTIELFQSTPVFAATTHAGSEGVSFPTSLEKMVFDLRNLTFAELSDLLRMVGSTYVPSVVYRVRLAKAVSAAAD